MIKYRPDIDGLRAIAVLSVVLYHLDIGPLTGGFVGVDIFFVISGFLITGIVQKEIESGLFRFQLFYERRVRRLFPALFLVLAATLVVGVNVLLPTDLLLLTKSLIATLFFGSNVFFWRTSGYFELGSEINPLLHTWSLAVEEQFYIVFPFVLLLIFQYARKHLRAVLVLGAVGSFAACIWIQGFYPGATFYLAPFRAWELLAGGILAVGVIPTPTNRWGREVFSACGLGLILYAIMNIKPGINFPGWEAGLPVLGSALIIYGGSGGKSITKKLLSLNSFVYVGLISYSLYLWHWPLIVYAKYLNGLENIGSKRYVILALAFVLASLSYHFVEKPFRRAGSPAPAWHLFLRASVPSMILIVLSLGAITAAGIPSRFDAGVLAMDSERTPEIPFLNCSDYRESVSRGEEFCKIGDPSAQPTVILWGDSHAIALAPTVDALLRARFEPGWFAPMSACAPLFGVMNSHNWKCQEHNSRVLEWLKKKSDVRTVIMFASWSSYSSPTGMYTLSDMEGRVGNRNVFPHAIHETIRVLKEAGRDVWLIGPTPGAPSDAPLKLTMSLLFDSSVPKPKSLSEVRERDTYFYRAVSDVRNASLLHVVDPVPWFCDSDSCRYADDAGMPLYRDGGHLNTRGARFVQPFLSSALKNIKDSDDPALTTVQNAIKVQ
jgi:peptidoglycan/LPS O-acetylase OafA/YrhL